MFKVENVRKVKFWKDGWYGDENLEKAFPKWFSIASIKEAWVD